MSWCRECHAEIRFAPTEKGSSMPLNAAPNPEGPIILLGHPGTVHWLSEKEKTEMATDGVLRYRFMPHWKTCSNPDAFRKKRPPHAA